jgi:hypothetical protein
MGLGRVFVAGTAVASLYVVHTAFDTHKHFFPAVTHLTNDPAAKMVCPRRLNRAGESKPPSLALNKLGSLEPSCCVSLVLIEDSCVHYFWCFAAQRERG